MFRGRQRSRSADAPANGNRTPRQTNTRSLERPGQNTSIQQDDVDYGYNDFNARDAPPHRPPPQYGVSVGTMSDDDESMFGNSTKSFATGSSSGMRRFFGKGGRRKKNAVTTATPPTSQPGLGPPTELRYYNQNGLPQQQDYGYHSDTDMLSSHHHPSTHSLPTEYVPKRSSNARLSTVGHTKKFNPSESVQILPDDAYPDTYMNYAQMEHEMNLKSQLYHDLRLASQKQYELGQLRVEVLQCFGLPSASPTRDPSAYAICVLGSLAFKTDIMPAVANPMWLAKMRRAALFPVQAAYHRLYVGIHDNGIPEHLQTHKAEEFLGRVCIDIARLRPGTMYDMILPLRLSNHVYTKQPQGCVRIRLHLIWASERNALLSYLPQRLPGGTVTFSKRVPNTSHSINCLDDKAFRDVAHTVHGVHMPGKFSVTLLKGTLREINFTRIHIMRYLRKREWWELRYWQYPTISLFVFCAWMHAVWFATLRYIPGHFILWFFLHMLKNYAHYSMDSPLNNGFLPPTLEELYWALMRGTKKRRRPCIQPLTVEPPEETEAASTSNAGLMTTASGGGGAGLATAAATTDDYLTMQQKLHKGYLLTEIAEAMRQQVKITPYRYKFRLYKTAFVGSDAVDYLISAGYAYSRPEAVHLGRRLAKECGLFDHVESKYMLEDEPYYYYFLDYERQRFVIKQGHKPQLTRLLETMGFYTRAKTLKQTAGGADILEAREHMEFPFATGNDHPRFTVKESLVTKSPEAKKILKEQQDAAELTDAAEFGVLAPDAAAVEANWDDDDDDDGAAGPKRRISNDDEPMDRRGSTEGGIVGAAIGGATRTVRRASLLASTTVNTAVNTAVTTAQSTVNTASTMATSAVNMATNLPNNLVNMGVPRGQAPVEQQLQVGDPEEIYDKLRSKKNPTLDYLLERQRQANEYDPYAYDSDNDVDEVQKIRKKGVIIEEKRLKKPPNQDFSRKTGKGDKIFSKTIQEARHKVHAMLYHMFNDHVYKIDKNLFPTVVKEDARNEMEKGKKKKGFMFNRRQSNDNDKDEVERRKKAQMSPYDQKQDEIDKVLAINKYSNSNPWINRVAVVIQPIVEMAQLPLLLFRALFNLLTWQDPILSFWVTFMCPTGAIVLYLCPYRIIFGVLGIYYLGPQNYAIRLYQESRPGYQPPDFDTIVKKKKPEKEENYHELQFFSSEAPGNQHIRFKNVDPAQVKQIVVPSSMWKYNRFYDWPPEPEHARAYMSAPPRSTHQSRVLTTSSGQSDDESDFSTYESDAYYYDAATPRPKKKKKKKKQGLKKVAHTLKKGTQAGFDATMNVTNTVYTTTGMHNVVDVATRTSTGAIKSTAKISKKAVKGTAKNTTGLFRRRKKNKYDDDEYY
jgi:hypothetical protein